MCMIGTKDGKSDSSALVVEDGNRNRNSFSGFRASTSIDTLNEPSMIDNGW